MRLPPAPRRGARVALVAPAGPLRDQRDLDHAVANVRTLGWQPVVGEHVLDSEGYFAGHDEARLGDLNRAAADPSVEMIWCIRGGYGAMRLLDGIDYDALSRTPRALIGFSDITALHAAIGARADLVTFHGPTARGELTDFSRRSLERALAGHDPFGEGSRMRTLVGGRATGPLVGGNLALLAALAGTPYAPEYDGAILVMEDVGEPTYRIDRMLRQLQLSGALARVAGIAFGEFTEGSDPTDVLTRKLDDVLREAAAVAGVPAIAGIPLGHIDDQWTIPLGAEAELDADARTLHVLPARGLARAG